MLKRKYAFVDIYILTNRNWFACCRLWMSRLTLTSLFAPPSSTWSHKSIQLDSSFIHESICQLIHSLSAWRSLSSSSSSSSGARFLISSDDALISRRWGLRGLQTPHTIVPPKRLGSRWGDRCLGRGVSRSGRGGQSRGPRQRGLTPLLGLPGDLAALEQRVEGGGPEAGLVPQGVEVIPGGRLPVEAERGAHQAVVAAPVVAAVAVEAGTVAWAGAWWPRGAAGDAGRAGSAAGHPGQQHVNQGPQNQAHPHGHAESYYQRDWRGRHVLCVSMCFHWYFTNI